MIYCYYISRGLASLHKISTGGDDVDEKPKKIGKFPNDEKAKQACMAHYEKACRLAENANRVKPEIRFV